MAKGTADSIWEYIDLANFASIEELTDLFGVSPMTVRRNLDRLEKEGKIFRVGPGAIKATHLRASDRLGSGSLGRNVEEKQAIAAYAVGLMDSSSTIFLDAGSTCYYLARLFPGDLRASVITYNLDMVALLREKLGVRVICPGGEFDSQLNSLAGPHAEQQLSSFTADAAFIGAGGLDPETGTQENSIVQIPLKRIMNTNARESYLLIDSTKLERRSYFIGTPTAELKHVITTTKADSEKVELLREAGVAVTQVPVPDGVPVSQPR